MFLPDPIRNLSLSTILKLGRDQRQRDPLDYGPATMEMLLKDAVVRDFLDEESDQSLPVSITSLIPKQHANVGC